MSKSARIIAGIVLVALLAGLLLYFQKGGAPSPPPASGPKAAAPDKLQVAAGSTAPASRILPPSLPPVPASSTNAPDASAANPDIAALDAMTADIGNLLQNGDIEAVADKYALPVKDGKKAMLDTLKRIQGEGVYGQARLMQMARAFASLNGQTPMFRPGPNQAIFYDRTIYGQRPPVPLDRLPPSMDPDFVIRIPITFTKMDGHWYLGGGTIGLLYGAVHTVSDPTLVQEAMDANAAKGNP